MFDFMINHISRQSKYYKDYQEKHDQSAYKDLFLNWDKFCLENRPTQADVDLIYKRKDRAPKQAITFADGTTEHSGILSGKSRLTLDVTKDVTMDFIRKTIEHLASNGCDLIRLDAFAYAVKKLDTNDFREPDIWDLRDKCVIWQEATVLSFFQRFMSTIPSNLRLPITTIMSMTSHFQW